MIIFFLFKLNSKTKHSSSFFFQISGMTCFMTYSVYSLNFANLFPQQSEYLMSITLYFLFSIFWTLCSMVWFIICNHFTTKSLMPKSFSLFCQFLQSIDRNHFVKLFSFTVIKSTKVTSDVPVDVVESQPTTSINSTESSLIVNRIKSQPLDSIGPDGIGDMTIEKSKCNFCQRCQICQDAFDKDKIKLKTKNDMESKCNLLNKFVFLCILTSMLISNIVLWFLMAN